MAYIGVDLHKKDFHTCYRRAGAAPTFNKYINDEEGLRRFIATLHSEDWVAVEASGAARPFIFRIEPYVERVIMVAPYQFRLIAKSVKKSDRLDAAALARGLEKDYLPEARVRSENAVQLHSVLTLRANLVRETVQSCNCLGSMLQRKGKPLPRNQLTSLTKWREIRAFEWDWADAAYVRLLHEQFLATKGRILKTEKVITRIAEKFPGYDVLLSVPNIGPITAATLLAAIDGIDHFPCPKKLAAYIGIVPITRQSGSHRWGGRMTKFGDASARGLLCWAAWRAMYKNESLYSFYDKIRKRRGAGKARSAVGRKFLYLLYFALKANRPVAHFEDLNFSDLKRTLPGALARI